MTRGSPSRLAGCARACAAALALAAAVVPGAGPLGAADLMLDEIQQTRIDEAVRAFRMGDYAPALDRLGVLAEEGVADAQYYLGFMNAQGLGVPQDFVAAASWYQEAAGQGHAQAQNHLGLLYFEGSGVPRSFLDAFIYFELAAAAGNEEAANNRLIVARKMTSAQITEAQKAAGQIIAAERATEAVVVRPKRTATGVAITGDGLVLTLAGAIEGCAEPTLRSDAGVMAAAHLIAADEFNRLVLLAGLGPLPAASLRAGPLEAGEAVTVVGFGHDQIEAPPAELRAAQVLRDPALARVDARFFQLDHMLAPGDLGAPVFDAAGRLAALAVPGLDPRQVADVVGRATAAGFALRADLATLLLDANGYVYDVGAAEPPPAAEGLDSRLRAVTVAVECWREDESWPDSTQAATSPGGRRAGGRRRAMGARPRCSFAISAAASINRAASCRCSTATARRSRRARSAAASARAGRNPGSATRSSPTGWSAG